MNFGQAIEILKSGGRVTREIWMARTVYIVLVGSGTMLSLDGKESTVIGRGSEPTFIAMRTVRGALVPWTPSQRDVLADDWSSL